MQIKFKLDGSKLKEALDVVAIVPPKPINAQGASGYLCVVRGEILSIYSQDSNHVARSEVPLIEVEGEGAFIYPSTLIDVFKYLEGEEITFTATEEGGQHRVSFSATNGAEQDASAFDPKQMATCDKELMEAGEPRSFPVAILRDAISMSRGFLAKDDAAKSTEGQFQALQIFDESKPEWEKGKGYLFASNSRMAFFFYSDAFARETKGLTLHGKHLSTVVSFLAKAQDGRVTFKSGRNKDFVIYEEYLPTPEKKDGEGAVAEKKDGEGDAAAPSEPKRTKQHVLGWTHGDKAHGKFSYYLLKSDQWVMKINRDQMLTALNYTRAALGTGPNPPRKIKLTWTAADKSLRFHVNESKQKGKAPPVRIPDNMIISSEAEDFAFNIKIDDFINLFEGTKAEETELRIYVRPPDEKRPKKTAAFRTIDSFLVDAEGRLVVGAGGDKKPEGTFECKVTRFAPSMD